MTKYFLTIRIRILKGGCKVDTNTMGHIVIIYYMNHETRTQFKIIFI